MFSWFFKLLFFCYSAPNTNNIWCFLKYFVLYPMTMSLNKEKTVTVPF